MINSQLTTYISKSQIELAIGIAEDKEKIEKADRLLVKGCNDDFDLQEFADMIAVLDKRSKTVLKARTAFVEPFKKDLRLVEIEFNMHKTELDDSLRKLNKIFIDYQMEVKARLEREAAARQEERRIAEEKHNAAIEREAQRRLAKHKEEELQRAELDAKDRAELDLFDDDVDEEVFNDPPPEAKPEPAQAEILPLPKPLNIAPPKIKTQSGATVKIKQEAMPIIRNKNLVPEIYKDVNLRRLTLAYEDGVHDIPGIEFVLKNKPVVR